MANKIKIKRSAVQGKVPITTDLELGELAINTYDGKLYTKKNDGSESVVQIGGASGATNLGVTTTTTSNTITSSTGTNATIGEATSSAAGLMSAAHHDKLDGIAAGAEVNVQSDWNATSGDAQILNKPTIPTNNNQLTNGAGYITATLTNEQVQDIVGGMVTGNTESGIAVTYQDTDGTLDFSVASQTDNNFTDADHAKLDGIEANATADQTAGEIKTAYESNTNTNAFTDAEKTKLSGIAAGAEVNVDTNLSYTASTRVLASSTGTNATLPEVVAAGNSGLMTGADKTKLNGIETGATADQTAAEIKTAYESNTNTNAFTDAEKTKLSGIEASADVTDASNVAAAGAVMESDTTTASMSFVIDEDTMVSNSSTKVPTQQSVKAYVDAEVAGVVDAAPGALDTLNELAAALGDDPNFATTVTNSVAAKLPLAGGTMTGNIVMSGSQTVDGRDLSVDGAKLDGIEAGATADQTASEIRALVESATDSNVFTDADHTKLNGIAAGAQVNVATNLGVTKTTTSNTITSSTGSNATIGEATGSAAGLMSTAHHNKLDGIASGAEVNVQSNWNATSGDALILNKPTIPTNNNQLTNGAGYITSADGGNAATLDGLDSTQFLRSDTSDTFSGNLTIDNGTGTNLIVKCDNGGNAIVRAGGDAQGTGVFEVTQDGGSHGGGMSYNGDGTPGWASGESADHVTFYRIQSGTRTEVFHYPYNSNTVNFNATPTVSGNSIYHVGNKPSLADLGFTGDSNANYITNNNQLTNGAGYITSAPATNLSVSTTTTSNTIASSTGTNATLNEATGTAAGLMSTAHHNKLDGIAAGAEVNVQSDWNATSGDAFIQNKPTIPTNNNQLTNGAGYVTSSGSVNYATNAGNADTVDSLHASSFLRSDAADTSTQRIVFQANSTNNWDTIATTSGSLGCLEVRNNGSGTDAFMAFHVGSDYACYFGLDGGTNKLSVGGWSMGNVSYEIYHSGNKPSLATLGFTGDSNANYITNNNQLTNGAGYITEAITNLGITKTTTTNTITSSSGTNATIGEATGSVAGLMSTAHHNKLDGIAAGAEVNVQSDWNATSGDALILNKPDIPTNNADLTNGAGYITEAITDLGITKTTTTNTITSSSGTSATISEATGSVAGLMSTAHHNKLDGIASGAEVNVQSNWNATSGDALILNKPTIPTNNNQLTNGAGYITEAITNLSYNATYRELSSSSGYGVTLPLATTSVAGLLSSSDKTKLDGLSSGASLPLTGGTLTGSVTFPAGAVDEPAISYDANTGIYFPGTDQFAISTAGSQRLYINSSGNVGIGQSSPGAKLDVNGDIEVNSLRIGRGPGNIDSNAVLGADAFNNNSTGYSNTALGSITLTYNTTGANNTAVGSGAMFTNTNGNNNTGVGYYALTSNSSGASNTAVGLQALYENTTGTGNVAVGFKSLNNSQTTSYNTAIGMYALRFNTSGTQNTAGGYQALASNTTGYYNTAFGYDAGESVTTGNNNTAIGRRSLYTNTTGNNNTAAGSAALTANYTGYDNVAVGSEALTANNTGRENVAVGRQALKVATTAIRNTAVGHQAGISITTGGWNTCAGYRALYANTTGAYNTACGYEALESVSSTNESVGVGYRALYSSTGSHNVAVGSRALTTVSTGSGNIGIGNVNSSGTYAPPFTVTTHSNRIVLGHTSITSAYVRVAWSVTSDERDKMNFAPVPHGLDFVNQLNPIAFQYKVDRDTPTPDGPVRYGFKAQDILALEGNDPIIIDSEDPDHLKYKGEHLVPVLVNAIQELTGMVKDLQAQVNALQNS